MMIWPQITVDTDNDIHRCFACGKDNPIGLKLRFRKEGEEVRAEFTPTALYQGWTGIVHGGIILTMLDEAVSWAAILSGINCLTAKMQTRLRQPALVDQPLTLTGRVTKNTKRLVEAEGAISLEDGTVIAEATATMYIINQSDARRPEGPGA